MPFNLTMRIPQVQAHLESGVQQVLDDTAQAIVGHMKTSMLGSKSGKIYTRTSRRVGITTPSFGRNTNSTRTHQASAPGQSPAVDKGDLFRHIKAPQTDGAYSRVITVDSPYGPGLEFGTSRIAPRPFMGPAFEALTRPFRAALRAVFSGTASKASQPYGFPK